MDKNEETREYLIPKGKRIHLQDGDIVEKGDFMVEDNPAPHDIVAIKGIEELAAYLVNEIQEVYRLQGVLINDKLFFFQAEDGIRDLTVTGVQTCALPI